MEEEWRDVVGFNGYKISNYGKIGSFRIIGPTGGIGDKFRLMKQSIDSKGYVKIGLKRKGETIGIFAHTMVLEAFCGPKPPQMECRHLDGNPLNNHIDNLKWGTRKENAHDRHIHGSDIIGEDHHSSKLNKDQVKAIKIILQSKLISHQKIADIFNVSRVAIRAINIGKNWKHVKIKNNTPKQIILDNIYYINQHTSKEFCDKFNVDRSSFYDFCRRNNIKFIRVK